MGSMGAVSTARPVRGQMTTVSKKTSKMPKSPDSCGVVSARRVCAKEDVPAPASFDNMPHEKPSFSAKSIEKPIRPPPTLFRENADESISKRAAGRRSILTKIVAKHSEM